jgi:hypothetical protein
MLLGDEDETFQNQIVYSLGERPLVVTAGAFKDHTKLDLVVISNDGSNIRIFFSTHVPNLYFRLQMKSSNYKI